MLTDCTICFAEINPYSGRDYSAPWYSEHGSRDISDAGFGFWLIVIMIAVGFWVGMKWMKKAAETNRFITVISRILGIVGLLICCLICWQLLAALIGSVLNKNK